MAKIILTEEQKKEVLETLISGVQSIINSNKYLKRWVDIILLKDFVSTSLHITNRLKKYNYSAIQVDPNMVLSLSPTWESFDDYISAFKSKFRVKAKKAYKTSSELVEKDFDYSESFNPNKVLTNREKYATIKKLEIFERIYLKI